MPRIPMPGKGKKAPRTAQQQDELLTSLRGTLRRLDEKELVLEAFDRRLLRIACSSTTKFLKGEAEMKTAELQPGDQLLVEASQDEQGRFYAARVTLEKPGTPEERAVASVPVGETPRMETDQPAQPAQSDDERPILRRAPATVKAAEPAREADDEGPPKLVRGKPAPRRPAPLPEETEAARPVETTPSAIEPGTERETDPLIEKAREMALSFVETLPNYIVKQLTTRFVSTSSKVSWNAQDNISSDVVYETGKESYRNVTLNGKPAKGKVEETGAWSTGEFGTVLRDLFSPGTAADFRSRGPATIVNRAARVYNFTVDQPNSNWRVITPGQTYLPAYRGAVWIDRETARVLRIEMQARGIPDEFPLDTVESATDYEFVRIGGGTFLLPTHSEVLSCVRGTSNCSRNVIEFRNYRKFGSESNVTFVP